MQYLFFDIDGTLMRSGGAGRMAMTKVMIEMFGISELKKVDVHGRTDRGIITELFEKHEIEVSEEKHLEFSAKYHAGLPDALQQCDGELLPGVTNLLAELANVDFIKSGILTGNAAVAAKAKLVHYDLESCFEFGGYGDDHACRNMVAAQALEACRKQYPENQVTPDQVWVIGDTVNDITCARSIGANVIAVATGGSDADLLLSHQPDCVLEDLTNPDAFLKAISKTPTG